ncbi:GNAT family N-acetyltransferase [Kibdelosporangium phytohabitans]|uniref:GCN5 family acetyltransferase n=1 Tax=Kibdelosporangium phytohabitans TaxID=860235 RepID=A0A0N9I5Z4_9PSEU|nr:GNAT family N-acetyltransferase [Kibdelosporangium phytohabitans]ALG11363.1 GCN5 family acetyltransferase [Kibdelosporangium phytohabitans]MBE1462684.1 GNAT superfamily N-acetyltransferase [Kibdelosporangium phytohabitans]
MSLTIRALLPGEEPLFDSLPDPGLVGFAAFGGTYSGMRAYRPEWTWIAQRDGVVVARAAWWGGPDDTEPRVLDWFDFTDADAAVQLLRQSPLHTEYSLRLPPAWREDEKIHHEARIRIVAAETAGYEHLVDRYRYRWTPECGLPPRPGRLEHRPVSGEREIFEAFKLIHQGTLDAHARLAIERGGVDAATQEEVDFLNWMPSPREWWRLAYTPSGQLAGISIPGRNHSDPIVGFIGVTPAHRGNGYGYDLLVECTHILVENGVDHVVGATDQPNFPMHKAFTKAGYPVVEHRTDLVWTGVPRDAPGA